MYKTTDDRLKFILKRLEAMKEARSFYDRNWEDYEKTFKLITEKRKGEDSWRTALADTWSYATIKTAQSAFVDSVVTPVITGHEDDDQTKSESLKDLYLDIAEKGNIGEELYYTRLDALKLGTGFIKTIYVKDSRTVHYIDEFDPETETFKYTEKEIFDFDDPKTVRVSPWLMLVDDMAKADMATIRDMAEVEVLGYEDAKRKYGHLVKDWDKIIPKAGDITGLKRRTGQSSVAETADDNTGKGDDDIYPFFAPFAVTEDQCEVVHYWNRLEDTYEIIANGKAVKVATDKSPSPIPYVSKEIPFSVVRYSPYSGDEFWAAGVIEVGRAESENIRKHREMMTDRQKLSLFSPAFVDVNTEVDQKDMKIKPLSLIRTRGGVPQQYQIPGISNADMALQDSLESSYKRAVGIDERVLGVSGEGSPLTATEISLLRDSALRRLREFAFLYKNALLREVKLKLELFKQYYSSPLSREEHVKGDKAIKKLKNQLKTYKVKVGNVYKSKEISEKLFEGDVDIDLDMRLLVPMTQSEKIAKWGQVLRDATPYVAQGMINLDIEKIFENYFDAMEVNMDTLKMADTGDAIQMAEGEHALFADPNTARVVSEVILTEGTPLQYLTPEHLRRHQELLEGDSEIGEKELRILADHIAKDADNLRKKMEMEMAKNPQGLASSPLVAQVGGIRPPAQGGQPPQQQGIINSGRLDLEAGRQAL